MHSNVLAFFAIMIFAIMGAGARLPCPDQNMIPYHAPQAIRDSMPNRRAGEDASFLNKMGHIVGRQDGVTVTVTATETICETGVPAPPHVPEETSHVPSQTGVSPPGVVVPPSETREVPSETGVVPTGGVAVPPEAPTQVHTGVPPEVPAPGETHVPGPGETHVLGPEETHAPGPEETHAPGPEVTTAETTPVVPVETSARPESSSSIRPTSMSTTAHTTAGAPPEATSPIAPISGAAYHTGVGAAALLGAVGFAALVAI